MSEHIPAFKVSIEDKDLTAIVSPRLINLTLTLCRGDESDQLDISLDDSDGKLALPPRGAQIALALGWQATGLVDMGKFTVDEVEHSGAPDTITLRARSAKREGVAISMDGRGRALDNIFVERLWRNVKYEDVYLKGYANMAELMVGLAQYFAFYNAERPHQSLGYQTPDQVYRDGIGGGALIVDRFGDDDKKSQEKSNTGQRRSAEAAETGAA
jgi:hypothetical protein